MEKILHRSMLILPAHVRRFVEKAYLRGADAILLDLEDAVPPGEKDGARIVVRESIAMAGKGGADVLVRINNEPSLWAPDMDAAWDLRFWMLEQVKRRFDAEGVEIPFPYRTVVYKKDLPPPRQETAAEE